MGGQLIAGQSMAQGVLTLAVQPAVADQTVAVAAEVEEVDGDALAHVGVPAPFQLVERTSLHKVGAVTCGWPGLSGAQGGDLGPPTVWTQASGRKQDGRGWAIC